ncbi:hypothetical protein SCLCIDRAFT_334639 [Scleroderma citrinum Foug A]|uniref:C2H2-type domain-containing protein n=1 Tax=Scleroderma citrinum Foug A TaxID=1036808 RepID=A0A0C2YZC9_9AGAM|nr:hypothetical protein SCLCIDRAFT_334639 [Scleroderma citrinum Foug A]
MVHDVLHRLASLQNTSTSLAALSLSSPPISHRPLIASAVNGTPQQSLLITNPTPISADDPSGSVGDKILTQGGNSNITRTGRKRGSTFTCESCSKVYRHPSCLIKHRWEHTPQWREASKFVLSKHQQVQLLELQSYLIYLPQLHLCLKTAPSGHLSYPAELSRRLHTHTYIFSDIQFCACDGYDGHWWP